MKQTDQTLLEQMRINEPEVQHRKMLFAFTREDEAALAACRHDIESHIDGLVDEFYRLQTGVAEIALLIGDADTLARLRAAQRRYVQDLFSGVYDLDYVNNRLRIGLVHKRIGVEPKLYLSAIHTLKQLVVDMVRTVLPSTLECDRVLQALDKLMQFDVTLVFDTYIRSLVLEIETARDRSDQYARILEEKVKERTSQLDELARTDGLTGLFNHRDFTETATRVLRFAERRKEPVTAVFFDVNHFKSINDTQGHAQGDHVLRTIGRTVKSISRADDTCFRTGGDEFCVIMSNCTLERAQEQFVARLNHHLEQALPGVTISVGLAQTGPNAFMDAAALIRAADEAMYEQKRQFHAQEVGRQASDPAVRSASA